MSCLIHSPSLSTVCRVADMDMSTTPTEEEVKEGSTTTYTATAATAAEKEKCDEHGIFCLCCAICTKREAAVDVVVAGHWWHTACSTQIVT